MTAFVEEKGASIEGFTLLELMVGLAVGLVTFTFVGLFFTNQTKTHEDHHMVVNMQQNGRAAIAVMNNELMMAGYAENSNQKTGVKAAGIDVFSFDYARGAASETLSFSHVDSEDRIGRSRDGGNRQSFLRDVETLKFLYAYDKDDLGSLDYGIFEANASGDICWAFDSDVADGVDELTHFYTLNRDGSISSGPIKLDKKVSTKRVRAVKTWILMRSHKRKN